MRWERWEMQNIKWETRHEETGAEKREARGAIQKI